MKSSIFNLTSVTIMLIALLPSCKEVGPNIVLKPNHNAAFDTTYIESPVQVAELKNVVIEEFTGVKCTNCPKAHRMIADIKTANPNRIVAVSMHPQNSLGLPYPGNPDLRNAKAQDLFANYFGQASQPIGTVDRKVFPGETKILVSYNTWTNYTNQEISLTTPVNLLLGTSYDSTTRQLTIATELHYTQNVTEENKLTIVLMEDSVIAAQDDNGTEIDFYVHKDVLRDVVTANYGDEVPLPHEAGRVIIKVYKITINNAWNSENMKVAAYVHEGSATSKNVYQGKEVDVE